ncbi:hypothetical protein [Gallibacterium salpingitidis]|uniref:hypothetical protein n=1 Tax=Gallibacterium salpingitidis TaxID=505341 RepID=UPI0018D42594|nr:hypothetical protein [Gallibacterium salpingitidis]
MSISTVASKLAISKQTIYANPTKYGFFKVGGQWRVFPSDLAKSIKELNNDRRLKVMVGDKEKISCRSGKTKTVFGKLTLQHQTAKEFDAVVKRLKRS